MTQQEINKINSTKSAVKGKIYVDDKGNKYLGNEDGRVRLLVRAKDTPFNPKHNFDENTEDVQEALEELKDNVENNVVTSLNTLKKDIVLKAGTNVEVTKDGQTITITFDKPADIVFDDADLVAEDKTLQEQIDDITDKFRRLLIDLNQQGFEYKDEVLLDELELAFDELTELK